jgi:hypothetical protein
MKLKSGEYSLMFLVLITCIFISLCRNWLICCPVLWKVFGQQHKWCQSSGTLACYQWWNTQGMLTILSIHGSSIPQLSNSPWKETYHMIASCWNHRLDFWDMFWSNHIQGTWCVLCWGYKNRLVVMNILVCTEKSFSQTKLITQCCRV